MNRFLGITVLGDFILSEGVEPILDRLQAAGATAVATNPTVTVPAAEGEGSFQPPTDAGSSPRTFDRPLFGKTALWVRSGPSFVPNPQHYADSPYTPRAANDLTEQHGHVIGEFIEAAVRRGLKVYLQLGAVQPSGLRNEDRPRLPDDALPAGRMADTGSLASEAIRAYNRAYVADLLEQYPQVSGFRPDWPEYPCYTLGEVFQDFGEHAARFASEHGFDFDALRRDVLAFYRGVHGQLRDDHLRELAAGEGSHFYLLSRLAQAEGVFQWLRMKAAMSADTLRFWRETITEHGGSAMELGGHAFMPPYSLVTGFDFAGAVRYCDTISPKLYTMHWTQMVRFWGDALLAANPGLDERLLVRAVVRLMDLGEGGERLADYNYPLPDEPHPIADEPQLRKIQQAVSAAGGKAPIYPLVHGYGPLRDFERRLRLVTQASVSGVWINRYGYLGDAKLQAIGRLWK